MFYPYVPAYPPCSGKPLKGTANLQMVIMDRFDRSLDYGIYNCRPLTTNAAVPSIHSDGRAGDTGFPVIGGKAHPQGFELVNDLRVNASQLGIMGIIWNRTRWDAKTPSGRPYTGPNPHIDHVHWEQIPSVAVSLTADDAYRLIGETMTLTQARLELATAWHVKSGQWMTPQPPESAQGRLTRLSLELYRGERTVGEITAFAPAKTGFPDSGEHVPAWVLDGSVPSPA